jgi:small subunit ribosomal protein S9
MNDTNKLEIYAIGRRKTSIAKVSIIPNLSTDLKNSIKVNGQFYKQYFQYNLNYLNKLESPLQKLQLLNQYQVVAFVKGGGLTGQISAIQLALARALCKIDKLNFRSILKSEGFLSRDSRIKERRKYGLKKARKASQSSKR